MKLRLLNYPIYLLTVQMILAFSVLANELHHDWKNMPGSIGFALVIITLAGLGGYLRQGRRWLLALAVVYMVCVAAFFMRGLLHGGVALNEWGLGFGGSLMIIGELSWAFARDRELEQCQS